MPEYKDFSKKKYVDIEESELQTGDVFLCLNGVKEPGPWKFVVGIVLEDRVEFLGKFSLEYLARIFADSAVNLNYAIDVTTKEGLKP